MISGTKNRSGWKKDSRGLASSFDGSERRNLTGAGSRQFYMMERYDSKKTMLYIYESRIELVKDFQGQSPDFPIW